MPRGMRRAGMVLVLVLGVAATATPSASATHTILVTGHVRVGGVGVPGATVEIVDAASLTSITDGSFSRHVAPGPATVSVTFPFHDTPLALATHLAVQADLAAGTPLDFDLPASVEGFVHVADTNGVDVSQANVSDERTVPPAGTTFPGTIQQFSSSFESVTSGEGMARTIDYPGPVDIEVEHQATGWARRSTVVED